MYTYVFLALRMIDVHMYVLTFLVLRGRHLWYEQQASLEIFQEILLLLFMSHHIFIDYNDFYYFKKIARVTKSGGHQMQIWGYVLCMYIHSPQPPIAIACC